MILLTGATGFIGTYLLDALINIFGSEQIIALTSKPINKCRFLLHDDYKFNKELFVDAGFSEINTIIHAGAYAPKSLIESDKIEPCNSNINNTNKLISVFLPHLKNFIFLSTLDVYGYDNPITEESIINPISLYGHSKLYCEKLVSTWATKNKINHQILRIGHVYGPGEEKYQKIIPLTMRRLIEGNTIQLYGSGNEIRSFIYIKDVVAAIINAMKLSGFAGVINIVGQEQVTISDLINKIISISKQKGLIENVEVKIKPRDLIFDNQKMKNLLHVPAISLSEGLQNEWNHMQRLSI